jgi:hypothetical protein
MTVNLASVGDSLVKHSTKAEFSAQRGVIVELYPSICEASKRMSSRAISRFLEKEHAIKLSAVTINKALNEPERYWVLWLYEIIPSALYVEHSLKTPMEDFMLPRSKVVEIQTHYMEELLTKKQTPNLDLGSAFGVLNTKWVMLSEENFATASKYASIVFSEFRKNKNKREKVRRAK